MGLQDAIAVFSNSTVVGMIEISNKKAEDVEGSAELEIQKAAKENWTGEIPNYFKFKLEALTPGAPEPASKEAINTGSKVTFEKITGYKEVKDYIYKISETGINGEHPEWTVSSDVLYAKVSVRKEGNEYKTKVSYYSDKNCTTAVETPVITNTYTAPTEGSAELEIQKAAKGNWTGEIPNYFKFKLEALTPGAPEPASKEAINTGSKVTFEKITGYKEVKDYIYKISETGINGEHPEWTVSSDVLYARVSVRKEGNEYKTKVSYYSDKNCTTAVETPVITNTYTAPTEGSAELEIQKAAKGNWTGEIPNYFKFKLEALTPGAPEPASKEAINTGSKVTFEKITGYKEVKDYIYKISETGINGEHPEWTVSSDVLYAKVSVRKEGNEYKTKVSYYSDKNCTTAVETPVITNTYTAPTEGSAELEIQKAAKGNWTGEIPNYFKFKLEALTPGAPEPASKEAINTGSKVTFEKITGYKEVKDYIYKISETGINGEHPEWTVSSDVLYAKVSVRKEGNEYKTKVSYYSDKNCTTAVETPVIINTYTTSGQIVLSANKTLNGQTLEAEQFSFQTTEIGEDGNAVENGYNKTAKNAEDGSIVFPTIKYEKAGTYYYQITEINGKKPAYEYDGSKYVVTVNVTDNMAGKLTAAIISVTKDGKLVENKTVTFNNIYSASADLELKAQKSMKVEAEQLGTFEFELKDADGKVIEIVKNDEKGAISFSKLSYTEKDAGKTFTYTVNEKLPSEADTYVYDKTVYTVTVNVEDNRDGTLKLTTKVNGEDYTETAMKFINDTTKVTISKVDDTTLKALAGAKLQVVDDQDKVVEEWTSDGTPHVLTAKLVLGKTYKLVEAEAPSGYEIAEPITFTVDADDTKNAVEMKDAMTKSKTAAIEITKELKLNDALAGAKDMTFYAALFADAECTIPASDVKALEFKNASSSTVTFTNLDLGRTYYVSETDVTGKAIDSGMTPDEKVYVPVYPQGQAITVTEDGAKSSITFENQFSEWPDGFYKIATLNVTKKLLGADGNALESDEIFYAGIFDDKECTTLSTRTEKNILTLDLAGGSTVSESTQAVVIPDESFTLYVAETDAEGNLVGGTDGFRYTVTVENGNVLFDENNLNAEVTIINKEQPEATPTVTPEETITPTPIPGTSTGVETGDDTPIGFYMALLFVAALAIEETTRRRRKKEQD